MSHERLTRAVQAWVSRRAREGWRIRAVDRIETPVDGMEVAVIARIDRDGDTLLTRTRHLLERGRPHTLRFDEAHAALAAGETDARLDRWIAPVAPILDHDRDLLRAGLDPTAPPLHMLSCHPLLRDALAHHDPITRALERGRSHTPRIGDAASGRIALAPSALGHATHPKGTTRFELSLSWGALWMDRVEHRAGGISTIARQMSERVVEMSIHGMLPPETAVIAAKGRALGELISSPTIDLARTARIVAAGHRDVGGERFAAFEVEADAVPADWRLP